MNSTLAPPIPRLNFYPETPVLPTAPADLHEGLERLHADCAGWALACCGFDRSEADDVLQSSYLKVLDGRAVYRQRSSFKTWLFGVIRRTATEHRRWRAMQRVFMPRSLDGVSAAHPGLDASSQVVVAEDTARLIRALGMLPPRQREVLHLVFYQELTIEESAGVLAVSLGTARTHYERGKTRLRALLGEENDQ
jgi:RNA polymerase sigma-70 factor, ECF subfamily